MSRTEPRFNLDHLRELAGDKVHARGQAYFKSGAVSLITLDAKRVVARVEGSENYRATLTGSGDAFEGDCTCPAIENWGFCKHLVATALAANAAHGAGVPVEHSGDRIRAHLAKMDKAALIAMILDQAERDDDLHRRLDTASAMATLSGKALEATLRKSIDAATRTGRFVDYARASSWARGVDAALDALEPLADGKEAEMVARLALHALARVERAVESMDDSDGYCMGLMERACDIHCAATLAARPDPLALAKGLFALECGNVYGLFAGAVSTYGEALGDTGVKAYRDLAENAWSNLGKAEREESYGKASTLVSILDGFAEREGDLDTRINLRMSRLASQWDYYRLAEFCQEEGRAKQALQFAEEGLFRFEDDRQNSGLLMLCVKLLEENGQQLKAEAMLWKAFEKQPDREIYAHLRKSGRELTRDRAISIVEAIVAKAAKSRWHNPADFLIDLLRDEQLHDAAWAAVARFGASNTAAESLARASEKSHPAEALAIYLQRVEQLADLSHYQEAVALIDRMAGLRDAATHQAYVDDLKIRLKRKRNLMKLLG
jgi:tetratricopeptide (TPR) repeat protein